MDVFSKLFYILSTGLFIALFMLLIEHPKRKQIGILIFILSTLLIIANGSFIIIAFASLSAPFMIFLDAKAISIKKAVIYLFSFFLGLFVFKFVFIDIIPIYLYPVFVLFYVFSMRKRMEISDLTID